MYRKFMLFLSGLCAMGCGGQQENIKPDLGETVEAALLEQCTALGSLEMTYQHLCKRFGDKPCVASEMSMDAFVATSRLFFSECIKAGGDLSRSKLISEYYGDISAESDVDESAPLAKADITSKHAQACDDYYTFDNMYDRANAEWASVCEEYKENAEQYMTCMQVNHESHTVNEL